MAQASEPVRHTGMREHNLSLVLGAIVRHGSVTRARAAELTGLTKTTVSGLVAALTEAGFVAPADARADADGPGARGERSGRGPGRPGAPVAVSGARHAGLGLAVDADGLSAFVLDLHGTARAHEVVVRDNRTRAPDAVAAELGDLARRMLDRAGAQGLTAAGLALALPGLVDRRGGDGRTVLRFAPNLGWRNVAPDALLAAHLPPLRLPPETGNEANFAALAERWSGVGAGLGDYIHVSAEVGIGAGLIIGGELFRGTHGLAGELGHCLVEPDGALCGCGSRGCLEQYASIDAMLRAAGSDVAEPTAAALLAALTAGRPTALAAVERAGRAVGAALVSAINLLDLDAVVLGGGYVPLAPWLSGPVRDALARGPGRLRGTAPHLAVSTLGRYAPARGAAGSVVRRLLADPALVI
ncbi:ROK family transcriptional regulator [Yinghuangia soli]|uniref:ROK family protein n=1 Tax=Yinghuangia soli TaxID=2908204 RepID=A0AA41Q4I9_9ACTN|nr:ROK family transcriptional regulator [Yinghuangia soli]MCF2531052.1 ROK family protein [Yinghuangia soli]